MVFASLVFKAVISNFIETCFATIYRRRDDICQKRIELDCLARSRVDQQTGLRICAGVKYAENQTIARGDFVAYLVSEVTSDQNVQKAICVTAG